MDSLDESLPPMKLHGDPVPWVTDKYLDSIFNMLEIKKKQSEVTPIGATGSTGKDTGQNTLIDK